MGSCTPNKSMNSSNATRMIQQGESSSQGSQIDNRKIGKNRNFCQQKSSKQGRQGKDQKKLGESENLVEHPIQNTLENQVSVQKIINSSIRLVKTDKNRHLSQSAILINHPQLSRSSPIK